MKKRTLHRISALALSAALCLSLLPAGALAEEDRPRDWWMEYYGMGWQTDEVSGFRFYVDEYCNIHWDLSSGPDTPPTDPDPADPDPAPTPDPRPTDTPQDTGSSGGSKRKLTPEDHLDIVKGELRGFTVLGYGVDGHLTSPDGVPRIGEETFAGCYSLTDIWIPDSVTSIGPGGFPAAPA